MRLLIAIYVPVDCHMWACCGPGQLPHMGQLCACSLPCMCPLIAISDLLIATYGPVVCHIGASCLPHVAHMWARQRPHVGLTWASVAKRVWPAHMCALRVRQFQLPHVCLVWPTCGMFAGYLKLLHSPHWPQHSIGFSYVYGCFYSCACNFFILNFLTLHVTFIL